MEYGFDLNGEQISTDDEKCSHILSVENSRSKFYSKALGIETASIYSFGVVIGTILSNSYRSKVSYNWKNLLEMIPDPGTDDKRILRDALEGLEEGIGNYAKEELGVESIATEDYLNLAELYSRLFPAFGHFRDNEIFIADHFYGFEPTWMLREYHSAPTFRKLVEEAFGSYRKDLARRVAESTGSAISFLAAFKGLITDEQFVELLSVPVRDNFWGWGIIGETIGKTLSDLTQFKRLSNTLRYRLIADLLRTFEETSDGWTAITMVEDAFTMLESIADSNLKRFRSDKTWDEVHSRAMDLCSIDENGKMDENRVPEEVQKLDGAEICSTRFAVLKKPHEFRAAGELLNNCMWKAGYFTKFRKGESISLIGFEGENPVAGLEILVEKGTWKVAQLNGIDNKALENRSSLEAAALEILNGKAPEAVSTRKRSSREATTRLAIAAETETETFKQIPELALQVNYPLM